MKVTIDEKIIESYPNVEIGYVVAKINVSKEQNDAIDALKLSLFEMMNDNGLAKNTLAAHPDVQRWRATFKQFGVKPKQFKCSLEALARRVISSKGDPKQLWNINNIVDTYNAVSVLTMHPMGGYDIAKLQGNLELRYAKEDETFLGLGMKEPEKMDPRHVIYADDEKITCWLWNFRDAQASCIDMQTEYAIFFIDDAFGAEFMSVETAVSAFSEHLKQAGSDILLTGVINKETPTWEFDDADMRTRKKTDEELPEEKKPSAGVAKGKGAGFFEHKVLKQDISGGACSHAAAIGDLTALTQILSEKSEFANYENNMGITPLQHAVTGGHIDCARLLLKTGAHVSHVNALGETALFRAARDGHEGILSLLIEYGIDLTSTNTEGETARTIAESKGHLELYERLTEEQGAAASASMG